MYKFSKNLESTQNSRRRKSGMKEVPYWEPTNIRGHRTKCSRHGDLTPRICSPRYIHIHMHLHRVELWATTKRVTHRGFTKHWSPKSYVAVPPADGPFADRVWLIGNVFLVIVHACQGTRRFIPVDIALRWIQSTLSYPTYRTPIAVLSPAYA
jgi:hypothetical protein